MVKIAHIADVHIRGLSRHSEFKLVFEDFVTKCEKLCVDHIFIGGDVFHTKTTGISPEYIDLLTWWLSKLADVAEVHIILGNHDGNLVNLSRQDAVSPIVQAINNPKIHLYKDSGVYEFQNGFNWCVFSIFDEPGWTNVKPVENNVNIACYHGPVCGAKTETDWLIEDEMTVDFFAGYDFVFLGDIHKRQFLSYRQTENSSKPWIGYSGSCIQQNYAEDIEQGFLLWEIENKDSFEVKFHKLVNPNPFVTLKWCGDIAATLAKAKKISAGSRIRVSSDLQLMQKDVNALVESLKFDLHAIEVTFRSDQSLVNEKYKANNSLTTEALDIRNSGTLMKLLREFHHSVDLDEKTWQNIQTIVNGYTAQAAIDDVIRNVKWSIKHLTFDNMFGYGEKNVINFENLNGVIGIFGPNRSGKSSIVGTLMYALFNGTDRGSIKNLHVINSRKQYCTARCVIDVNGNGYVIERQTTKTENKRGQVNAPTALNVFQINDGELIDLAGEQRNDSEKVIRKLIGSPEDFLLTSLSAQDDIKLFIMQGSTKRRQILSRLLDLDIFDKMHFMANEELKSSKAVLRSLPERDWNALDVAFQEKISDVEKSLSEKEALTHDVSVKLDILKHELAKHSNFASVTISQVETQRQKVKSLQANVFSNNEKIVACNDVIAKTIDKIIKIEELQKQYDSVTLKQQLEGFNKIESSITALKHALEKEELVLKQHERSLKILNDVPCDGKYETCKFIKDACAAKEKFQSQSEKVNEITEKLDEAKNKFISEQKRSVVDKLSKLEQLANLLNNLRIEQSNKNVELVRLETTQKSLDSDLVSASETLQRLELALSNDENAQVVAIKKDIEKLASELKRLGSEKMQLATEKGRAQSEHEKSISEKNKRNEVLARTSVYELIASAFSKHGIPSIIASSRLPVINSEIAKILQGIVDFSVELEFDVNSDSTEIYINYGDEKRIVELGSGMEKMIASVAIRVALINMSTLPKTDIFIIDEGFGALDDSGVEACNRLLGSLKRFFKTIIVITHVEGVKDAADFVLEISKFEKNSQVIYN